MEVKKPKTCTQEYFESQDNTLLYSPQLLFRRQVYHCVSPRNATFLNVICNVHV